MLKFNGLINSSLHLKPWKSPNVIPLSQELLLKQTIMKNVYKPVLYRLNVGAENSAFDTMVTSLKPIVYDTIESQIIELILCQNPSLTKEEVMDKKLLEKHLEERNSTKVKYGVWVYYPWKNQVVHILDEEEFIEVRTNRNKYKITQEEQEILRKKIIGIAGLSVGRSVALTIALERVCGEIRLADFDDLELSNLNRISAPLTDMGVNKTVSAVREILEIDPFLKVKCYEKGLTADNMDSFFCENGKLDLFIEECDGLDIKVLSRMKAKELGIPVLMEASDRSLVDIERFDLEPDRELLHGRMNNLSVEKLASLKTSEEKIPYMLDIVGYETLSRRIKASMVEIGESIRSWPQLASAINYGAGLLTDVARRILLNQIQISGRFYNDIEDQINNNSISSGEDLKSRTQGQNVKEETGFDHYLSLIDNSMSSDVKIDNDIIRDIVEEACLAASIANSQPWKWVYKNNVLFLFLDRKLAESFWDRNLIGAQVSLGAAIRNLGIASSYRGIQALIEYPNFAESDLVASIKFKNNHEVSESDQKYYSLIFKRFTNRKRIIDSKIGVEQLAYLKSLSSDSYKVHTVCEPSLLNKLSKLLGKLDRIRLLNKNGQVDFYKEIDFSKNGSSGLGIPVNELLLTEKEYAGLRLAKDPSVSNNLTNWGLGQGLDSITSEYVRASGGICFVTANSSIANNYLKAGEFIQQLWLDCTDKGIAIHPITTAIFMFNMLENDLLDGLSIKEIDQITSVKNDFYKIFKEEVGEIPIFLFRFFDENGERGMFTRREISKVLYIK